MHRSNFFTAALLISTAGLWACSDDDDNRTNPTSSGPTSVGGGGGTGGAGGDGGDGGTTGPGGAGGSEPVDYGYTFDSRFTPGQSPVAYNGQAYRHALIEGMKNEIGNLTTIIDDDSYNPADAQAVFDRLDFYYNHDGDSATSVPVGIVTDPAALQTTYGDYPSHATLDDKLAGQDTTTDYRDWSTAFTGWADTSIEANGGGDVSNPEGFLQAMMWTLATQAYDRSLSIANIPNEPGTSTPISTVFVTETGLDLQQLIQKFLLMGVTYAQATDDYLQRDGSQMEKGLFASNAQSDANPYSTLGHHWDEAFGYWGGARDFSDYTDGEIAGTDGRPDWQGYHDTDGDMRIDLMTERNWGASVNAAKRDVGATDPTDFTLEVISAFYQGRVFILQSEDTLEADDIDVLEGHARDAVEAWERAIAATIVHYINDVIADTTAIDGSGYVFLDHAKHFSEMKGFALGLQFNPNKRISDSDFDAIHSAMGDAPVTAADTMGERTAYITALQGARTVLMNTYGFSQANVENW